MVSNSAQLDCSTKQHTQFGVSASNGSRDMARTKSWRKKKKKKKKKMNASKPISSPTGIANKDVAIIIIIINVIIDRRTKQHTQFGVSASNGSRDMARTKSWRKKIRKKKIK